MFDGIFYNDGVLMETEHLYYQANAEALGLFLLPIILEKTVVHEKFEIYELNQKITYIMVQPVSECLFLCNSSFFVCFRVVRGQSVSPPTSARLAESVQKDMIPGIF